MKFESGTKAIRARIYRLIAKYVLTIIIVSFIPMFINSAIILFRYKASYQKKVEEHLRELVLKHKRIIDSFLGEKLANIRYLSQAYSYNELKSEPFLQERLQQLHQAYDPVFVDLGVIARDGRQVAYAGPFKLAQANYSNAGWFTKAIENSYYISDVFLGLRGLPHFIITVRNNNGGEPWVLRATIDFAIFNTLVEKVRVGQTGFAYILNREGEFQTKPFQDIASNKDLVAFFADQHSKSASSPIPLQSEVHVLEKTEQNGQKNIYVATFLKDGDWLLVYQQELTDVFGYLQATLNMNAAIIAVTILLIILVIIIIANRIIKQITFLVKEREELSEKMVETSKLVIVGELAAGVAHEINNPVAIMVEEPGWINDLLAEEELKGSKNLEEFKRSLRQIETQGKRCKEITHKLLSFARKTDSQTADTSINSLILESVKLTQNRALFGKVAITTHFADGLPLVRISPSEFQQILINFIHNALDAMEDKGGSLTIGSRRDRDDIVVEIKDTGIGIPEANLSRLFNPFFTTKPVGKGTGLGLSICYGLIKKMGGDIEVKSEVGAGTTFTIRIPIQHPQTEKK